MSDLNLFDGLDYSLARLAHDTVCGCARDFTGCASPEMSSVLPRVLTAFLSGWADAAERRLVAEVKRQRREALRDAQRFIDQNLPPLLRDVHDDDIHSIEELVADACIDPA